MSSEQQSPELQSRQTLAALAAVVLPIVAILVIGYFVTRSPSDSVDTPLAATTEAGVASPESDAIAQIEGVRGSVAEARTLLAAASARDMKGTAADLAAYGLDLDAVEAILDQADDALFYSRYADVDSLTQAATQRVDQVKRAFGSTDGASSED